MKYSQELKNSILKRMLPPNNESASKIAREEGITSPTLRKWKKLLIANEYIISNSSDSTNQWTTEDKFQIVVETAGMNEIDLAACCRTKGIYAEQVRAWKDACMMANGGVAKEAACLSQELNQKERDYKALEKELLRKEKALAETAALLVLRKKADAIWGEPADE